MRKTKAIIFDLDGTAINSPEQTIPSPRLAAAIQHASREYYVCAATGRPWSFAKPVIQGMGLTDPCIVSGGTQICDSINGTVFWQCNFKPEEVEAIKNVLLNYPGFGLLVNDFGDEDYTRGGKSVKAFDATQTVYIAYYLFVPDSQASAIEQDFKAVKGVNCVLSTSLKPGYRDINLTSESATKEQAVTKLLEHLGVDKQDTWGFGDGLNDLSLFNAVNRKVAMGNAKDELKEVSDEVIGHVTDDGLAKYIERL